jgi:uncharacterized HAD superfamily protein
VASLSGRIYVDLDDVLSETARAFLTLLEKEFGKTVAFDEITDFDLGKSFGLDADELARFMHLGHQPKILRGLRPIGGAIEGVNALYAMGYQIDVITGRPPATAEVSKAWLTDHRIPYHRLTFVDKYNHRGWYTPHPSAITLDELTRLDFCFAVEDSAAMALFLAGRLELPVALLERPWNQQITASDPKHLALIERCADWGEILEHFNHRRHAT